MCGDPKDNQAHKKAQGAVQPLDFVRFVNDCFSYEGLVAGEGFEPSTFGL